MLTRCEEIMRDVCESFGAELREFNGEGDHVHLLVHYPPKVALSKLVNCLKGVSSRYLRRSTPAGSTGSISTAVLVPVLLRRVLRWRTAEHRQGVHREPEAPRLTVTPKTQRSPALRASGLRIAFPPGLKAGIPFEDQGWSRTPHQRPVGLWQGVTGWASGRSGQ